MMRGRQGWFGVAMAAAAFAALTISRALAGEAGLDGSLSIPARNALLIWGEGSTLLRSADGLEWSRIPTPARADLNDIAANPDGSVLIAVGHSTTLLRSVDAGQTWRAARSVKAPCDLRAVINVPGTKNWLAVGTRGRILRSANDGRSWTLVESELGADFLTLYFDALTKSLLIGGEGGLVGVSRDQGLSWDVTAISMPDPVTAISAFRRINHLLLATSTQGRFLLSADGAQRWDFLQASTGAAFTGVAWDPARSSIVLPAANGDVLRSPDGGQSWEGGEISLEGRKRSPAAIVFDARSQSLLVAGGDGLLARSTDGGRNWSAATAELRGDLRGFIVHGDKLVAYGRDHIWVSTDSGAHWTAAH